MTGPTSAPVVFLAFANDQDAHLTLLEQEAADVKRALKEPERNGHIEVAREESADVGEIFTTLSRFKDRVAIFHYGGHADGTTLRLEDVDADSAGLAVLLGEQTNLRLVFLNGCATKPQVDALLGAGVKAVIATSVSIRDDKATDFATHFYQCLAKGRTIGRAFALAESHLQRKYRDRPGAGIITRDLSSEIDHAESEELPWALHVTGEARDEVLNWKLPSLGGSAVRRAPVVSLAFPGDRDEHRLLLEQEAKEVLRALQEPDRNAHIKVTVEETADEREVVDTLVHFRDRVAIFHFGGHAESTTLRLQETASDPRGLAARLGEQANLRLVFLNGRATRSQVDTLFRAGVKAVIATSVPKGNDKATDFATRFYQALGNGRTIEQAFLMAEGYLRTKYRAAPGAGIVTWKMSDSSVEGALAESEEPLPWALYVASDHEDEALQWKLPYYHAVGLPKDMIDYIRTGVGANRWILLVLDEMARYNPDIYDQMTEMRLGRRVRKDSRVYPELIIRNLPWPIGSQIRLLQYHDSPDGDRLEHLISTYVRTGQLLYAIALSDLWERRRQGELKIPEGFESGQPMSRETFATFDFFAKTCELIQEFHAQDVPTYVPEFERLRSAWGDEAPWLRAAHAHLEALRQRRAEGPVGLDSAGLDVAEQAVSVILLAAAFLSRYRMLTVRDISIQAARFDSVAYDLNMGPLSGPDGSSLNLYQDSSHRRKQGYANSGSIVLVRDEDLVEGALNLSPFIMDKNTFVQVKQSETSNKDRLAHLFMLAYEEGDRLVYLSVDHSVEDAMASAGDQLHTDMTRADFTEGRNLGATAEASGSGLGPMFGLGARFGVGAPELETDEEKTFAVLKVQFDDFKADIGAHSQTD